MMVWTAAQTAWSAATTIATGAQWLWNAALAANPMIWIIVAIVALVAAIVVIATKTTWFQQLWTTVWGAITTAFDATVAWLSDALGWFGELPGKFAGWFGSAKDWAITKLMELVTWAGGLPGRLWDALANLGNYVSTRATNAFQSMKDAAVNRAVSLVTWMSGLPGRLVGAIGSQAYRFYNMGLDFVYGLWDGISAAGGWLWNQVKNFASNYVVEPVKDFLHIGSPSKLAADEIGHWIPAGIAMGAEDNAGVLDKAMRGLVNPAVYRPDAAATSAMAPYVGAASSLGGARAQQRFVFEFVGGSRAFREFFQESVRTTSGGDVVKFAEG
jgi:phage-related protein